MEWLSASDYWLSRLLLQRALAGIYLVAFLVARNQFRPLLGERGLLPAPRFLRSTSFRAAPTLFHLRYSDRLVAAASWTGIGLAGVIVVGIADRGPIWVSMFVWSALWILYLSIVNIGQVFYGFGWESLLLEAGFLAIFLGPAGIAPPVTIVWLFRWLLFRVEFGAGLIKLRGDSCWRDLTCLHYHHETQPMPNRWSWHFHRLPPFLHKVEVLANHGAQLVVPFALFGPQPVASIAGAIIVVTQLWLVFSGNFSWLNVLTIVLAFAAIHDGAFELVLPIARPDGLDPSPIWHQGLVLAVTALIVALSYWPARNLVSRRQLMNFSFNRLHLVNTYGAFGSITRVRHEVVIEGTEDPAPGPDTAWKEYEFKGKPVDPRRRPPQIAPYHLHLDWLMWFVGISPTYAGRWFMPFIHRLLENDAATLALLRRSPFDGPPAFIRARLYRYRFTTRRERRETEAWWVREEIGEFMPPTALSDADTFSRSRRYSGSV